MSSSVVLIVDQSKPIVGEKSFHCYEMMKENGTDFLQRLSTPNLAQYIITKGGQF
jgi:hypothetical protein